MKRKNHFLFALLTSAALAVPASAATLVGYNFNGNVVTPTTGPFAGTTATNFTDGSGYSGSFNNGARQVTNAGNGGSATSNADAGNAFTLTLTALTPGSLSLDGLQLSANRSGSSPDRITVFLTPTKNATAGTRYTFVDNASLSSADNSYGSLTSLTSLTQFQGIDSVFAEFVFHGNNQGAGSDRLDNVVLAGSVIPEPSSVAMILGGACILLGYRRRNS